MMSELEPKIKEMQQRYDELVTLQGESIANPAELPLVYVRISYLQLRSDQKIRDCLAQCQKSDCKLNSILARCKHSRLG